MQPVVPTVAGHLDKTSAKRHAFGFMKLRVLELPYVRTLLLDLDLLPRLNVNLRDLFHVPAPAAKYCCSCYWGPEPVHGKELLEELRDMYP